MRIWILAVSTSLLMISCELSDDLDDFLDLGLTDAEIVEGLKEALEEGVDSSVHQASQLNGYLANEIIKIVLPPEVAVLKSTIDDGSFSVIGINVPYSTLMDAYVLVTPNIDTDPFDELTTAMNRGAEQAADLAVPIFTEAITNMSFADALNILQGDDKAATTYFKGATSTALVTAFSTPITTALGDTKALEIYSSIEGFMNYEYTVGSGLLSTSVNVNDYIDLELPESIEGYATEKAVDGLFHLIGEEEAKIRDNPFAYASDIIQKVFGSVEASL